MRLPNDCDKVKRMTSDFTKRLTNEPDLIKAAFEHYANTPEADKLADIISTIASVPEVLKEHSQQNSLENLTGFVRSDVQSIALAIRKSSYPVDTECSKIVTAYNGLDDLLKY